MLTLMDLLLEELPTNHFDIEEEILECERRIAMRKTFTLCPKCYKAAEIRQYAPHPLIKPWMAIVCQRGHVSSYRREEHHVQHV